MKGGTVVPEGFVPYVPCDTGRDTTRADGRNAAGKLAERAARIRHREKARLRRLREQDADMEAAELYQEFVGSDGLNASEVMHASAGGDDDSRLFWENLTPISSTDCFRHCAASPYDVACRGAKRSRPDRLGR